MLGPPLTCGKPTINREREAEVSILHGTMSKLALKNSKLKETEASLQQETVRLTRDLQEERRVCFESCDKNEMLTSESQGDLEKLAQANKSLDAAKAFLSTPDEVPKCQVTQFVAKLTSPTFAMRHRKSSTPLTSLASQIRSCFRTTSTTAMAPSD